LNAYAIIAEQTGVSPVSGLALVYTEPVTDDVAAKKEVNQTESGFLLEFSTHIRMVDLAPEKVPALLAMVRETYELPRPPQSMRTCKNCALLEGLIKLAAL
jgi:hypothetical protein